MSNQFSDNLKKEMYAAQSADPFLLLVTLTHDTFSAPIYLVNNTVDILSRSLSFTAFPMTIALASDDGESAKEVSIEFDNVSLDLIDEIRSVTTPISVLIEMVLASNPNFVEYQISDLKMRNVTYNKSRISAKLFVDSFFNQELTSEKYTPSNYKGIF